jgi:tetratricopeptide (TPR) repeat protein
MAQNDKSYYVIYDYRIGMCYYHEGNYEKAISHLKIYLGGKNFPKRWPTKQEVKSRINKAKNKLKNYRNLKDKDQLADRRRNIQLKIEKHKEMGDKYSNQRRYSWAIGQYRSAYNLTRRSKGEIDYYLAYKIAECYEKMKNFKKAISYYKKYMRAPSLQDGWPSKATVRSLINNHENLLKKENSAKVGHSNNYNVLVEQADKFLDNEKYEKAAVKYEEAKKVALRQGTYSRLINYKIGAAWQRAGKSQKAIDAYKMYIKAKFIPARWPSTGEVSGRIRMLKQDRDRDLAFSGSSKDKGKGSKSDYQDDDFRVKGGNYGSDPIGDDIASENSWLNSWWFYAAVGVAALLVIGITFSGGGLGGTNFNSSGSTAPPAEGYELYRF